MKKILFPILLLNIFSCLKRDCNCSCEKFRYERSIISINRRSFVSDTFVYFDYKTSTSDTLLSDSIFNVFMREKYLPDSYYIISKKDTFRSIKKVSGITCSGTNQYYADTFSCLCSDQ